MNSWDICRIFWNEVSILCSLLLFGCVFLLLDIRMELEEFCCYFQMLFICCENPKLYRQGRRLWLEVPDLRRQLFHATSPQLPPLSSAAQLMFLITRRYFSPESSVSHSGGKGGRGRGNVLFSLMQKPQRSRRNQSRFFPIGLNIFKVCTQDSNVMRILVSKAEA